MITSIDNNIFLNSTAIELLPVVSCEFNQNLFNPPYITVAGLGNKETVTLSSPSSLKPASASDAKPGSVTSTISFNGTQSVLTYTINTSTPSPAYKIITYVKTDNSTPIIANAHAIGSVSTQFGSATSDVNSFGYTPIITYVGSTGLGDNISSITYKIVFNSYTNDSLITEGVTNIFITTPEVYQTTYFDYQNGSLWPTDSPFQYFRPGESYVNSGNAKLTMPSNFRKVNTTLLNNQGDLYAPVTPILQNPTFGLVSAPTPFYKNAMPNILAPYQYFVSDPGDGGTNVGPKYTNSSYSPSISSIYEPSINTNKLVIKFNTIMTVPNISIKLDNVVVWTGDVPLNGVLILYYNGSSWTTSKWSNMPKYNNDGTLSLHTSFNKMTITQNAVTLNSNFSSFPSRSSYLSTDILRMHLVESSPRLEIDVSDYVMQLDINKQLDSKNNYIPISSINPNDATLTLSAIPFNFNGSAIPIFSSQSNQSINLLTNNLRKNIKFYFGWELKSYFLNGQNYTTDTYIQAGTFYSNSWDETDISIVKITCYDIVNYLQTTPVPDFVSNLKSVFDTITTLLDLAGFTDYDYDTLYRVCNDNSRPMDLYYYFCNSQDSTIYDALSEIFLSYQIGAYIDENGVMQFLSLSDIVSGNESPDVYFNDSSVIQGGYSITSKAKPGKISIRYQPPKVLQSLALQNATDPTQQNSPSFIYTTSNDILWEQKNSDAVGFNYLASIDENNQPIIMNATDSVFSLNVNDIQDIFHTYSLNTDGYAIIENEVVSFLYKEYSISDSSGNTQIVSVKNDLELSAAINSFVKRFETGLQVSTIDINGFAVAATDYNITVKATGRITNVQRGLFGTFPATHSSISNGDSISTKDLYEATASSNYSITKSTNYSSGISSSYSNNDIQLNNPNLQKIQTTIPANNKVLVYPANQKDVGFQTYSAKFDFTNSATCVASGIFFNMPSDMNSAEGAYFVEFTRFENFNTKKSTFSETTGNWTYAYYNPPQYKYYISIYKVVSGVSTIIATADATGAANNIVANFEKVLVKQTGNSASAPYTYALAQDAFFDLKVVWSTSNGDDGEIPGPVIEVFLNNFEITGWNLAGGSVPNKNKLTSTRQMVSLPSAPLQQTQFGYFTTTSPYVPSNYNIPIPTSDSSQASNFRELYATSKPLKERSVSYFFQDREFLNGLIQGQNLFAKYNHYICQTNPDVKGINTYDVQYTTPGATVADINPVFYKWFYFPGTNPTDQQFYQQQTVDEYSLAYSTALNTGFRGKFAVANNSNHMVYLQHTSDTLNSFTTSINLWTHEVIAPSDSQILEKVLDPTNLSEVVQVDSSWIQSKEAANRLASVISFGNDGFSRDTSLQVFGNPLIQVGDIVDLTYTLAGILNKKYLVHEVSHTFQNGLKTTLTLNQLNNGTTY